MFNHKPKTTLTLLVVDLVFSQDSNEVTSIPLSPSFIKVTINNKNKRFSFVVGFGPCKSNHLIKSTFIERYRPSESSNGTHQRRSGRSN